MRNRSGLLNRLARLYRGVLTGATPERRFGEELRKAQLTESELRFVIRAGSARDTELSAVVERD